MDKQNSKGSIYAQKAYDDYTESELRKNPKSLVDVESTESQVTELMDEWKVVYKQKENDYGNSWQKTGAILDILLKDCDVTQLSPQQYNMLSLFVRMIDKMCRFSNLYFSSKASEVKESLTETMGDLGVYCFMSAALVNKDEEQG